MDNTKRPCEEYKIDVLNSLRKYGNFKSPDEEAKDYMASEEVDNIIKGDYLGGQPPESCAWFLDIYY